MRVLKTISIVISIILAIAAVFWGVSKIMRYTSTHTNDELLNIVRKHSTKSSNYRFGLPEEKIKTLRDDYSVKAQKALSEAPEGSRVLYITLYGNVKASIDSMPNEIYALFESYLYLRERNANDIVAINCEYHGGGLYIDATTTIILWSELEEIYASNKAQSPSRGEAAMQLAESWMDTYHYNRIRLTYTPETKYRQNLRTPWSLSTANNTGDKRLWYRKPTDFSVHHSFYVKRVTRTETVVSSTGIFEMFDIKEDGYLYGAWDERDNIWLYGETIGLVFVAYDGDTSWAVAPVSDMESVPYALKKVMATLAY